MFEPIFEITPSITKDLMAIEAARQAIIELPMDVEMLRGLHETARLLTTHYSTQIEGNRLTRAEVAEVISGGRFPGRERDESEVRNYYQALQEIERLAKEPGELLESDIKLVHGLAFEGRSIETMYRDGQNIIRDGVSGGICARPFLVSFWYHSFLIVPEST